MRLPKPGQHLCGLTRSYLHQLCMAKSIRSVSVCRTGKKRGVRLLYLPSIHGYLDGLLTNADDAAGGADQP